MFDDALLAAIHEARTRREPACLCTIVRVSGSAPQRVGARLLVRADGSFTGTIGGGVVEARVLEDGRARLRGDHLGAGRGEVLKYQLTQQLGMCCGGTMEVFIEPLRPSPRLLLFGAGHVGAPTAALAARCGFEVWVIDEREAWNTAERFPSAARRVLAPHPDFLAEAALEPGDYAVITTRDHQADQDILAALAPRELAYLGMIGSRRKVARALLRLEQEGVDEARRRAVHAPIGLDIGADSPDEIAVSILAQLIAVRARREGRKHKADGADLTLALQSAG